VAVACVAPAATCTEPVTVATAVLTVLSVTVAPPAGAGDVRLTVKLTLPPEFGGQGYTLNQYTREARRLAQERANRLKTESLARRQARKLTLEKVFARLRTRLRRRG